MSLTDRELFAAANRLDERKNRAAIENGQEKRDSGTQSVRDFPRGAVSGSNSDPWTEALRVAIDPTNLCQALQPEKVINACLFIYLVLVSYNLRDYPLMKSS